MTDSHSGQSGFWYWPPQFAPHLSGMQPQGLAGVELCLFQAALQECSVCSINPSPHHIILPSLFRLVHTQGSSCLQSVCRWVIVVIFKYHQLGRSHQALSARSGVWDSRRCACLAGGPSGYRFASWQRPAHSRSMNMHPVCEGCIFILILRRNVVLIPEIRWGELCW